MRMSPRRSQPLSARTDNFSPTKSLETLNAEEWQIFLDRLMLKEPEAIWQFVLYHLPLARWTVRKYLARRIIKSWGILDQDDLLSEAIQGLRKAIENYDLDKSNFSTYASLIMIRAMELAIAEQSLLIRISREKLRAYRKQTSPKRSVGGSPSLSWTEFFEEHNLPRVIGALPEYNASNIRLSPLETDPGLPRLVEMIADPQALSPETIIDYDYQRTLRQELFGAFKELTPRQRQAIALRFGRPDGKLRTFDEIGAALKISRQASHILIQKALLKLKIYFQRVSRDLKRDY